MDSTLPDNFDLIVVGTGMIESIVAAAASRIGKKVLHVDSNDYYGGAWASFNIEAIEKYLLNSKAKGNQFDDSKHVHEGEHLLTVGNNCFAITHVTQNWYIPKEPIVDKENKATESELEKSVDSVKEIDKEMLKESEPLKWTQERIIKESRKYNLDMAPKLQFARGDFVELLISSNIARYSEYRSVSRVLTWLNGELEVVPCSRSDVFSNTKVSVVEKRMLMKLLTTCMDGDESQFSDYANKTFNQYLKDKKLTGNLIHYVLYAISMSTKETLCAKGVENTKRFLNSLGRFGKTPFLYSMYGSGELPQAFCRLCAVFGGTYCLTRPITSLILDSNDDCLGIVCADQRINAKNVVLGLENVPEKYVSILKPGAISRAIFITDRSLLPSEKENLTLLLFPPDEDKNPITVIELGPATGTCPLDQYIIHMYCKQKTDPQKDLEHCAGSLLRFDAAEPVDKNEKPRVLWSLYYSVPDTSNCDLDNILPSSIHACAGPDLDLDYDNTVNKAKTIFKKIYPECEFLPRAPDPEEIILCDDKDEEHELKPMLSKDEDSKEVDEIKELDESNEKSPDNIPVTSSEKVED